MIETLFFYLFAGVMLASSVMVVVSRNPVYSVLFLILAFFNAAGLFVLIGQNFGHAFGGCLCWRGRGSVCLW